MMKLTFLTLSVGIFVVSADPTANEASTIKTSPFEQISTFPNCTEDQNDDGLSCLLELFELMDVFPKMNKVDVMVELSKSKSEIITKICSIYNKYDKCINEEVFEVGDRCLFREPINLMPQVSLSLLCNSEVQKDMGSLNWCFKKLSDNPELRRCTAQINQFGPLMGKLMNNGKREMVCEIFYMMKGIFSCMRKPIVQTCGQDAEPVIGKTLNRIILTGVQHGCPAQQADEFYTENSQPEATPTGSECTEVEEKKLKACYDGFITYEPPSIAFIVDYRIEKLCQAYEETKICRKDNPCNTTNVMDSVDDIFTYGCGDGSVIYKEVIKCLRGVHAKGSISKCEFQNSGDYVLTQEFCQNVINFLSCVYPPIVVECGEKAGLFASALSIKSAISINPNCDFIEFRRKQEIIHIQLTGAIEPSNCTKDEMEIIASCSTPMEKVKSKVRDLFKGGVQQFIRGMEKVGKLLAEGCDVSREFKNCIGTTDENRCKISTCILNPICDEQDIASAVKKHLQCVFSLIAHKEFTKCVRSSFIATDLKNVRKALPKFISCTEDIVLEKCGVVPVSILKKLSEDSVTC